VTEAPPLRSTPADAARAAAILGFFAVAWFSWGNADASPGVATALGVGAGIAVVVTIGAVVMSYRTRGAPSAVAGDPTSGRRYGIVVGIEVLACFVGAAALGASGAPEWIPVWICAVVGAHFVPLTSILHDPWLTPLAVVMLVVAAAGAVTEATTDTAASTVVGAGAGLALGAYAIGKLGIAVQGR
jgi:hypothetical protein